MNLTLSLTLPAPRPSGGGSAPPAALAAPIYDDFEGTTANLTLNARVTPQGAQSWAAVIGANNPGVVSDSLKTTATGEAFGGGTSAGTANHNPTTLLSPGYAITKRLGFRTGVLNTLFAKITSGAVAHDLTFTGVSGSGGTDTWNKHAFGPTLANGFGNLRTYSGTAMAGGQAGFTVRDSINNAQCCPGDTYELRRRAVSAQIFHDIYQNGRLMVTGTFDFATSGVTINGNFGLGANLEAAASKPIEDVWVVDTATDGWITVLGTARVLQLNDNGSLLLNLQGEYGGTTLTSAEVVISVFNAATKTALTGYTRQAFTTFSASAGTWYGTITVAAAALPASFGSIYSRIDRTGLASSGEATAYTCVGYPGELVWMDGQSITTQLWAATAGAVTSFGWTVDGSNDAPTVGTGTLVNQNYIQQPGVGVKSTSFMNEIMVTASGLPSLSTCVGKGGKGGTFLVDAVSPASGRNVGTSNNDFLLWGIKISGNNLGFGIDTGGTFEAADSGGFGTTLQQTYVNALNAKWDGIDALGGRPIKVAIAPVPSQFATNSTSTSIPTSALNVSYQAMRRLAWWLVASGSGGGRYVAGPPSAELNHSTLIDVYHMSQTAWGILAKRHGYTWARGRGYTALDHTGPVLSTLSRTSGTTVVVRVDNRSATTVSLQNEATDYRCGLSFGSGYSTSTGFVTGEIIPTNAVVTPGAPAGYTDITFTFASVPATVYMVGPYGSNPFCRDNNATIKADLYALGAMIVGNYSSGDKIAINPWFNPANLTLGDITADFMSAS